MLRHPIRLDLSFFGKALHVVHLDGLALAEDLGLQLVVVLVPLLDLLELPHVAVGRCMQVREVALEQVAVDRVREGEKHVHGGRQSLLPRDSRH